MPRPHDPAPEIDARLGRAWREHRRYVLDIALRMLGDLGDAEDAVQEAFARLLRADLDEIEDVRAWLVTVVSRQCLDQLRSARRRRQDLRGDAEPATGAGHAAAALARGAVPDPGPAERATLDDSVRLALQVVLARLSPAERTAFVLHDVFRFSFDDIADIVGRTPAACRQLASRARRQVGDDARPARFSVGTDEERRVTDRFIAACTTGDLDALVSVLDPDVAGQTDIGGGIGLLPPVTGRDRVVHGVLRYLGPGSDTTLVTLPVGDEPTVVALRDGEAVVLLTLTVRHGRVDHIHVLADPERLAPVSEALRS